MLCLLLLGCAMLPAHGETLAERFAGSGQLIVTQLTSAPFPHPKRAEGHTYQKKLYPAAEHYSDNTVAIFIPKGFRETGEGLITAMAYDPLIDHDLVVRDLAHLIPSSNTKIAYLKHNYLPLYSQHFIDELLIAAEEITA